MGGRGEVGRGGGLGVASEGMKPMRLGGGFHKMSMKEGHFACLLGMRLIHDCATQEEPDYSGRVALRS